MLQQRHTAPQPRPRRTAQRKLCVWLNPCPVPGHACRRCCGCYDAFATLPDEIVWCIFRHVAHADEAGFAQRLPRVCKRWQRVCKLQAVDALSTAAFVGCFTPRAFARTAASFRVKRVCLTDTLNSCKYFHRDGREIPYGRGNLLATISPQDTHLLNPCSTRVEAMRDANILEHEEMPTATNQWLAALADCCPDLASLKLTAWGDYVSWPGRQDPHSSKYVPPIEPLDSDDALAKLLAKCTKMHSLVLYDLCGGLAEGLVGQGMQLTQLRLGCNLSDEQVAAILHGRTSLTKLDVGYNWDSPNSHWGDEHTGHYSGAGIEGCPNLRELDATCNCITDAALVSMATHVRFLTRLNLDNCLQNGRGGEAGLSDTGMRVVLELCTGLTDLSASMSEEYKGHARHRASNPQAPDWSAMCMLTDSALSPLAGVRSKLARLDCSHWLVTDAALRILARSCPDLTELVAVGTGVTGSGT